MHNLQFMAAYRVLMIMIYASTVQSETMQCSREQKALTLVGAHETECGGRRISETREKMGATKKGSSMLHHIR